MSPDSLELYGYRAKLSARESGTRLAPPRSLTSNRMRRRGGLGAGFAPTRHSHVTLTMFPRDLQSTTLLAVVV